MTTLNIIFFCAGALLLLVAAFCVTAALRGEDRLVAIVDTPTSSALDSDSNDTGALSLSACAVVAAMEDRPVRARGANLRQQRPIPRIANLIPPPLTRVVRIHRIHAVAGARQDG